MTPWTTRTLQGAAEVNPKRQGQALWEGKRGRWAVRPHPPPPFWIHLRCPAPLFCTRRCRERCVFESRSCALGAWPGQCRGLAHHCPCFLLSPSPVLHSTLPSTYSAPPFPPPPHTHNPSSHLIASSVWCSVTLPLCPPPCRRGTGVGSMALPRLWTPHPPHARCQLCCPPYVVSCKHSNPARPPLM